MLKRVTQVEPETVRRLVDLYRESMDQLARNFESPQAMEQAYAEFLTEFVLPRWTNYARGGLQPTQKDACIFLKDFPHITPHIPSHPKG